MNNKTPLSVDQAFQKISALCAASEKCGADVLSKLQRWGLSPADADAVLSSLRQQGFVDDARFARAFASDKARFAKWGPAKIAFYLRSKQISQADVDSALASIDSDCFPKNLADVLEAKFRNLKYKDKFDARAKLLRFGVGRGFPTDLLLPAVDKIISEI